MKQHRNNNIAGLIALALKEDAALRDAATLSVVPADRYISARVTAKSKGIVCGLDAALMVFKAINPRVKAKKLINDGALVRRGCVLATIRGPARAILSGERTALNFISHLSGIATLTRKFVDKVKGTGVKIYDTRKTVPGMRALAKYAVACGGGANHRMNLADMAMLKDNHLALMEGSSGRAFGKNLSSAVKAVRKKHPGIKVEVECDSILQLADALSANPDVIMLDNMKPAAIRQAVKIIRAKKNRPLIEISGGITLKTVRRHAVKGADYISVGAITHSAPAIDIALDMDKD